MEARRLREAPAPAPAAASDGVLHDACMPPMGLPGAHETRTRVMPSPAPKTPPRIVERLVGEAEFAFLPARFEDLPTMVQVVNTLAALPVPDPATAAHMHARGKGDLADRRRVRRRHEAPETA